MLSMLLRISAAVVILIGLSVTVQAQNRVGDADNNGVVEMTDAALTLSRQLNLVDEFAISPLALANADANLDLLDAMLVGQAVNSLISISGPGNLLNFTPPPTVSATSGDPSGDLDWDTYSYYSGVAENTNGLNATVTLVPPSVESTLSAGAIVISGNSALTSLTPINTTGTTNNFLVRLTVTVVDNDGANPSDLVSDVSGTVDPSVCGNGWPQPGETCDEGGESAICDDDCTAVLCGDTNLNAAAGEMCDDGNTVSCDGCSSDCSVIESGCGDGVVCGAEACDDGQNPGMTLPPIVTNSACSPTFTNDTSCMSNDPPTTGGTVIVDGTVEDIYTVALSGVLVEALGMGVSDTTDAAGVFSLVGLPDNTRLDLRFSKAGYTTAIAHNYFTGFSPTPFSMRLYDDSTFAWLGAQGGLNHDPLGYEMIQLWVSGCTDAILQNYTIRLYDTSGIARIRYTDGNGLPDSAQCPANSWGTAFIANIEPGPFVIEVLGTGDIVIARSPVQTAEMGADGMLGLRAGQIAPLAAGPISCDGCAADCSRQDSLCGDSISECMEVCDDGGTDTVSCDADCTLPSCGDSYTNTAYGEFCDTGGVNTQTCDADCTEVACGDAHFNPAAGEECEIWGGMEDPGCDGDCTLPSCGDGYVNIMFPEQCDDGPNNGVCGYCDVDCWNTLVCGDGDIDAVCGEICDDGANNGTGPGFCLADCSGVAP